MVAIAVLGSTGSIGMQTLSLIRKYPEHFTLIGVLARGRKLDVLQDQIESLRPSVVAVTDSIDSVPDDWITGLDAVPRFIDAISGSCDVIINAIEGIAGVLPSIQVLKTGTQLALANKETLVCAGKYVKSLARRDQIWPIDSEHSALAQALRSGYPSEVNEFVITASGGPFRGKKLAELEHVVPQEALTHPTWSMGELITVNSATLVNKALEVIEAHELFGISYDAIRVTVHPQSIIHSMVTFCDGATIAQASPPSMLIPISYAITGGKRLHGVAPKLDFSLSHTWTFEPVDELTFPAIAIARFVGAKGGVYPAIFTAASETAARAFLASKISFPQIMQIIGTIIDKASSYVGQVSWGSADIPVVEDISDAMQWAVEQTGRIIG